MTPVAVTKKDYRTTIWCADGPKSVVFKDGSYFPALFAFLRAGGNDEVALKSVLKDAVRYNRFVGQRLREIQRAGDDEKRELLRWQLRAFGFGLRAWIEIYRVKNKTLEGVLRSLSAYHEILSKHFQDPDRIPSEEGTMASLIGENTPGQQ